MLIMPKIPNSKEKKVEKKDDFSVFAAALKKHGDIDLSWAESGSKALDMASGRAFDLMVTDEELGDMTGLELTLKLLSVNPMINSASVSSLSTEDFHEASEGLGLMMQLSSPPSRDEAGELLERLRKITGL